MTSLRPALLILPLLATLLLARDAGANHSFTEDYEALPCCLLTDAANINRQVTLVDFADVVFRRDVLADFLDEPLLPISNDGDLELLWDNDNLGDRRTLGLTQEYPQWNHPCQVLSVQPDFAIVGDLPAT